MTRRYSRADWRDILYNAVRQAPGGVVAAAAHLTDRRGVRIHPEDLRRRLRGADGETLSTEMLELLTEWLLDMRRPDAMGWLQAFNARFDMAAAHVPPLSGDELRCEVAAIREKLLHLTVQGGTLADVGMRATADGLIDGPECDALEAQCMEGVELLMRLRALARRAAGREGAA